MSRAGRWSATVLALVLATGCSGPEATTPPPSEPGPVVAGLAERCPDKATPIPYPSTQRLPDGAVGVRLCNGVENFGGNPDNEFDVQVPADELTIDVEDLVAVVNLSEAAPTEGFCPADAGPNLVFWFRYDDGTALAVHTQRYGCRWLVLGDGVERTGGDELYAAFDERLAMQVTRAGHRVTDQRNEQTPVGHPSASVRTQALAPFVHPVGRCTPGNRAQRTQVTRSCAPSGRAAST